MKILAVGDIHGAWSALRARVEEIRARSPVDLVLQCGDAQPVRDATDLQYLACPEKFRVLGDFWRFHQGEEQFPVPLLFIGGNHEPWNHLDENLHGGELAPNIHYLGRAGLWEWEGLRIAGIGGVYSPRDYESPHPRWPYPSRLAGQAAHFRNGDVNEVMGYSGIDILLCHEWPALVRQATRPDATGSTVGSEELSMVVESVRPRWVFCGHMHRPACVTHGVTDIVCLSDFTHDPDHAVAWLDTESGELRV